VEVTFEEYLEFGDEFKPLRINVAEGSSRELAVERAAEAMMDDFKTAPLVRQFSFSH
jgi:hypothetical protein